jgi:hypothetical protein
MNETDINKIQAREIAMLRNLVNMQTKLIEDFLRTEAALIRELQELNAGKK